ncbi:MAG: ComEA family DNA-binding protein [Myxococcaceae bacterium]
MKRAMAMVVVGLLVGGAAEAAGKRKASPVKLSGVLNLNQASAAQLDLLPGVGEKAAQKIIAYRQKTPFKRVEELVKVKGFGKKKFEKIKPYLAVAGPTTLTAQKTNPEGKATPQARAPAPKH